MDKESSIQTAIKSSKQNIYSLLLTQPKCSASLDLRLKGCLWVEVVVPLIKPESTLPVRNGRHRGVDRPSERAEAGRQRGADRQTETRWGTKLGRLRSRVCCTYERLTCDLCPAGQFTLRDMYEQFQNIMKMGPFGQIMVNLDHSAAEVC